MAFSAALRRAASAAAPLAIRAAARGPRARYSLLDTRHLGEVFSRETVGPSRTALLISSSAHFFSSVAGKPASDAQLLKVIDSEIKCAEESDDHDRVEEIPRGFPFEIQDEKGVSKITLKRKFQGENIEVVVSMPSLVTGEDGSRPRDEKRSQDEDDQDLDFEKPTDSSLPLTVTLSKGKGPTLEFICTAYPDEIIIDSMSVTENKESDEEMIAYEGPDFNDLDRNLQNAFHKYLELRGISPMTTNFLHEYMINKDSREYLLWLRELKQFIQK